jgi:hypothetical protein
MKGAQGTARLGYVKPTDGRTSLTAQDPQWAARAKDLNPW